MLLTAIKLVEKIVSEQIYRLIVLLREICKEKEINENAR